ncbi:unnamed protein product [Brassica rapa subsp. trilocularis]
MKFNVIWTDLCLVFRNSEKLAAIETWDDGKTYEQAKTAEIPMLARFFHYYTGWADKICGLTIPADGNNHVQTLHERIGIAGQTIPWNFPLLMFLWKVVPTLACGNTIVLKKLNKLIALLFTSASFSLK